MGCILLLSIKDEYFFSGESVIVLGSFNAIVLFGAYFPDISIVGSSGEIFGLLSLLLIPLFPLLSLITVCVFLGFLVALALLCFFGVALGPPLNDSPL